MLSDLNAGRIIMILGWGFACHFYITCPIMQTPRQRDRFGGANTMPADTEFYFHQLTRVAQRHI